MAPFLLDNSSSTASFVITDDYLPQSNAAGDVLVRLQFGSSAKSVSVSATNTQTILDGMNAYRRNHLQDIELLGSVISWQKRTIDYQALHMAFLLNSLSEEDFEQESEKFIVRQGAVDPSMIAAVVEKLDTLVGLRLDTSDYADYFQCTQENVMSGLRQLSPHSHFAALLPALANDA